MSENKTPRDIIHLVGKPKERPIAQQAQQNQSRAAAVPKPGTTPGRRPLFGR